MCLNSEIPRIQIRNWLAFLCRHIASFLMRERHDSGRTKILEELIYFNKRIQLRLLEDGEVRLVSGNAYKTRVVSKGFFSHVEQPRAFQLSKVIVIIIRHRSILKMIIAGPGNRNCTLLEVFEVCIY